MSGIKYEVLAGDDLISALRGGRTGDLLDDAAYAAADEIESLRSRLAEVHKTLAPLVDDDNRPVEALARHAVARLAEYERDFVASCSLHAHAGLEARLAEAEKDATRSRHEWQRECEDTDLLLQGMGLCPSEYRSECGSLLLARIRHKMGHIGLRLDETLARLAEAEAQRFPHGAAAVTGCDMKINDEGRSNAAHWYERAMKAEARLQKIMARCADLLDEDQFNELDAMTRTAVTVSASDPPPTPAKP